MRRGLPLALLPVAFLAGGCQYLFGLGAQPAPDPFGSFDPGAFESFDPGEFSFPPPQATFTKGTATVTIGGVETVLDKMPNPGSMYAEYGLDAIWTDGNGLYLRFFGTAGPGTLNPSFLSIDKIADGRHWTTSDLTGCKVTVDHADATGIAGSGTCTGMRWTDAMAGYNGVSLPYVEGEAPFDLAATFQATP